MAARNRIQQFLNRPLASHVLVSGTRKQVFDRAAAEQRAKSESRNFVVRLDASEERETSNEKSSRY